MACHAAVLKGRKANRAKDEARLVPEAIRLVDKLPPATVMLENVRGLLDAVFDDYRNKVEKQLKVGLCALAGDCSTLRLWRVATAPAWCSSVSMKDLVSGFSWPEPAAKRTADSGRTAARSHGRERLARCQPLARTDEPVIAQRW